MKPRIGIDFHVFDGKYQGSRTHLIEILTRVVRSASDIDFYIFLDNINTLITQYPIFTSKNVKLIQMPYTNSVKRLCYVLPILQKEYSLDLLHSQYIMPIPSLSPSVVTIHDILFESHPQYFKHFFRYRSQLLVKLSAKRSSHIFTVSEFCKNELVTRYQIEPKKITVIYNGVDRTKFYPGTSEIEIVEKRGLKSEGYILSVGRLEPRKNYDNLFAAYAALGLWAPPLVIIGQRDFGYQNALDLISKLNINVKIIEDISDNELPAIYRHAKLFVYPSYAEGFGIPPLEAMASGVPVICSNTTAIPEVTGDAAYTVNPSYPQQITKAMHEILSNMSLQLNMSQAGLAQANKYTWEVAADATLKGYSYALNQ